MAVINEKKINPMSLPMNIERGNPIPLDTSEVWYSYEAMASYAASGATAYVGQILALVDKDNASAKAYIITNTAGDLQEVGKALLVDNKTIELTEDNALQLKNFGAGYYKYTADGYVYTEGFINGLEPRVIMPETGVYEIAWYEPSLNTVDGVNDKVETLSGSVETLSEDVSKLKDDVGVAGENATGLFAEVAKKANAEDVYTKNETNAAIAAEVAKADHLQRVIVNSIDEIDVNATDADRYIYMVSRGLTDDDNKYYEYVVINKTVEPVGSWEVDLSAYAKTADVNTLLADKVDKDENARLITNDEAAKLANIAEEAEKNFISSVDEDKFTVDDAGKLGLQPISITEVTGLEDALAKKMATEDLSAWIADNKETTPGLFSSESAEKLNTAVQQANFITSVASGELQVVNGELSVKTIDADKVTGFSDLANSVDNLNIQINGDPDSVESTGLVGQIAGLQATINGLDGSYVTIQAFNKAVGDIDLLQAKEQTLSADVEDILEMLTWGDMSLAQQ